MRPLTFYPMWSLVHKRHITTATIGFNMPKKQQEINNNPQQFKKEHYTKIKILKRTLKRSAKRRKLYQVVWKLLKDTICDIQGQRPPPVMKSLRKSKRKTAEPDNRRKEVVRKK